MGADHLLLTQQSWTPPQVFKQELPEDGDQVVGMWNVVPPHGRSEVVDDYVADPLRPMLAVKKIASKRGGDDLGDMLMLTDGLDLLRREVTKPHAVR